MGHGADEPQERIEPPPDLLPVLESAARLHQMVPDAVLVGGTARAAYAGHRISFDHDHVLDLQERYEAYLIVQRNQRVGRDRAGPTPGPAHPRDRRTLEELPRYKGLVQRWQDWTETRRVCGDLAQAMLDGGAS